MNWVLVSRKKGTKRWKKAGPYVFPNKSDFGSLASLKRANPEFELKFKHTNKKATVMK